MTKMRNLIAGIFFAIIAVIFFFSALMIHPFGQPNQTDMDDYIIGGVDESTGEYFGSQEETGANNAVTSVVFDYRGFDTLGEATVLFTAVAGVILIFRRLK
jgi:multisubunit Na+/H+ antiporter MnhB subunit